MKSIRRIWGIRGMQKTWEIRGIHRVWRTWRIRRTWGLWRIWKCDIYRLGKSKLFYGIAAFTCIIAFLLVMLIRQDIRLGISIFGDITAFKKIDDVIRIGTAYQKGLGILAAVLISIFTGQEYQWQTWQHKWMTSRSRILIYLSKAVLLPAVSAAIFLIFQIVVLLASGQVQEMLTPEYAAMMVSGVFVYTALGSVICLLSMLIKSNTASIVVCLGYVMFSETMVSVMRNLSSYSNTAARLVEWIIHHSVYGMSMIVSEALISTGLAVAIFINSLAISLLSAAIGISLFRKYEL
jgi:ABC-type transport system involved in multi-copper enzyme maturation permease subunit